MDTQHESLLDRALRNLREGWRDIARATPVLGGGAEPRPHLPDDDARRVRQQMRSCLETRGGEVSARARAAGLGQTYLGLDRRGRRRFLEIMARDFDVDHARVADIAGQVGAGGLPEAERARAEAELHSALEAPRLRLLTQFNALPQGVKFLVDLRADLLAFMTDDRSLAPLDRDLRNLLRSWFDVGFLDLRRITWDAPASLLEKLIAYEAVHEIEDWADLKNRLDSDRRCFAFFHNRMPDEPLIFVEVALVNEISSDIQKLLDKTAPVIDPRSARTAIFYSISNAQRGLAGISFGSFLIKRVVDHLSTEFPQLRTFATLSPVPGFMDWLAEETSEDGTLGGLLSRQDKLALKRAGIKAESAQQLVEIVRAGDWITDNDLSAAVKEPMMRACACYLLEARRGDGRAYDPVANFHLSNGARLEAIDWLADRSSKGIRQSAGIMVNYLYRLDRIEANHESYRGKGDIAASSSVRALTKP